MKKTKLAAFAAAIALACALVPAGAAFADNQENATGGGFLDNAIASIASFFGLEGDGGAETLSDGGDTVSDASTIDTWQNHAKTNSTETVGRIWTDKTVQNENITLTNDENQKSIEITKDANADFLIGLSALSSTSNLTTITNKPLDIVLVLDISDSMKGESLNQLKQAAKSFARKVADMSSDEAPNRLGVVSFASSGYENFGLSNLTPSTLGDIESDIDKFTTRGGGSRYGDGMKTAYDDVLKGKVRDEAQPIVIVIGDGDAGGIEGIFVPSISGWDIANETLEYAGLIKKSKEDGGLGGIVYSIGVFNGADENDNPPTPKDNSHWNNVFLQEVSSNYPEASAWDKCGTRADDAKYYLAGQNYSELEGLLDQIASDVREMGVTSPTHVEEGFGGADGGYITFTDTLGDYMEVKGNEMTVIYANQPFTGKRQSDGSFEFSGKVDGNPVYQDADMANLIVKVARGEGGAGDTVTVQIPAQLIPLRNYTVDAKDTDSVSMSTADALPIRVFYNVGLQEGVEAKLAQPDEAMQTYIKENAENGAVNFYSNDWNKENKTAGTTAEFTPALSNKFYYFTERTPLYKDDKGTQRVTEWEINRSQIETVYYKNFYYEEKDGTGVPHDDDFVAIPVTALKSVHANNWDADSEGAYMKAGVPRLNRLNDFNVVKGEDGVGSNATDTATKFISPSWNDAEDGIVVSLGNNGKRSVKLPATLAVSKEVEAAEGFDASAYYNTPFQFDFAFTGVDNGTYQAQVKNAEGKVVSDEGFKVEVKEGKASHSLKHGETLYIYGLPAGATYTVTENLTDMPYFTSEPEKAEGTFEAGVVAHAEFVNTYKAEAVEELPAHMTISVEKVLENRDWRATDSFSFTIEKTGDAPAFQPNTEDVNAQDKTVTFDTVTFDTPGEFVYYLHENHFDSDKSIPGITYSNAVYRVTVEVVDNKQGALEVESVSIVQVRDGEGNLVEQAQPVDKATFTNAYVVDSTSITPRVVKDYTDNSGGNPLVDGMFTAQLEALGGYKTGSNPSDGYSIPATDVPMPNDAVNNVAKAANIDHDFGFSAISFTGNDVGNTYVYKVTERNDGAKGMTYDTEEGHLVEVSVSEVKDLETGETVIDVRIDNVGVTLANVYDPVEDAVLSGDSAIGGTKTLTGRAMLEDEHFDFTLTPTGKTLDAVSSGVVTGIGAEGLTAQASGGAKAETVDFSFGGITFTRVGTYTFEMEENAPADTETMAYDRHICTVTVDVKLNKEDGTLYVASVDYGAHEGRSGNTFVNAYTNSETYSELANGGLSVSKTMSGRTMDTDEFTFTINGAESDTVKADEANAKLTDEADKSFANVRTAADTPWSVKKLADVLFTQEDAGKTFSYIVDEIEPDKGAVAVTYDKSEYRVDIAVSDDGKGAMSATTSITKVKDAEGNATNETVEAVAFANSYNPGSATLEGEDVLSATKRVEGAPWNGDPFTFTLKLTSDNADGVQGLGADGTLTASTAGEIADGGEQKVTFAEDGAISFSKPGTYMFEVSEKAPGEKHGWTWDTDPRIITVTVTNHDAEGNYLDTLVATVDGNNPTITNRYEADPAIVGGDAEQQVTVNKQVTGWETDADFTFALTPVKAEGTDWSAVTYDDKALNEAMLEAGVTEHFNAGDIKTATFGTFAFGKTGTYTFSVVEKEAAGEVPSGWTYDKNTRQITVTVTDEGHDGQLDAVVSETPTFTNRYEAAEYTVKGETELTGTKTLTGRDSLADETFGFTMTPADDDTEQAIASGTLAFAGGDDKASAGNLTNGVSKGFNFGDIAITAAGTYTFNVTENLPDGVTADNKTKNGVTYDTHTGKIAITVTDEGTGVFDVKVDKEGMDFTNAYAGTPATYGEAEAEVLGGHKSIDDKADGFEMKDGQFTFFMRAMAKGDPMPEGLDAGTDDQGRSVVSVTNQGTSGAPNETAAYDFGSITFTSEHMKDATDNGDGTRTKDFRYNIWEGDTSGLAGIQKDNNRYGVRFTVTENLATGKITIDEAVAVKFVGGAGENEEASLGALDFVNVYDPTKATGYQNILKTLEGRDFQDGDTFVFDISLDAKDEGGKTMAQEDLPTVSAGEMEGSASSQLSKLTYKDGGFDYTATISPRNTESGNTYITNTGEITYNHVGTYTWKVKESAEPKIANVTNSTTEYTIVVKVEADGNSLKRTVESIDPAIEGGSNTMGFTNTYRPSDVKLDGESAIKVQKTLANRDWTSGDVFTFKIAPKTEGAPMPEPTAIEVKSAAKAGEAVKAAFGDITFTKESMGTVNGKPAMEKTFVYEINETNTDGYGLTMDKHVATVRVKVTDDGKGTLTPVVTYDNSKATTEADQNVTDAAAFTNTYAAAAVTDGTGTPSGVKKVLNGRVVPLQAGEFGFTMNVEAAEGSPSDGFTMPENATATNDAEGAVAFENIAFTKAGTYHVTVAENVPAEEADRAPFIKYDTHAYTYDVVVTDNGVGQLVAEVKNEQGDKTFTNTYEAKEPSKTVGTADNPTANIGGTMVGVGDELTYTINWVNDAMDEHGKSIAANVTIADTLPSGTEFVSATEDYALHGTTVTWRLGEQPAGATGSVQVTVRVTDDAVISGNEVANEATIAIGGNKTTVKSDAVFVPSKTVEGGSEGTLQVGDTLTYTVKYTNDQDAKADVTIVDTLPKGVTVDTASIKNGIYDPDTRTITWIIKGAEPGIVGEVTFTATVNEDAVGESVDNQATVKVGENEVKTNTSTTPVVKMTQVSISKEIVLTEGQGTVIDENKAFEFTVNLADKNGDALSGTYAVSGIGDGVTVKDGGTLTLKHGQIATIENLPEGSQVTATETLAEGYTPDEQTKTAKADGTENTVTNLAFVNTYNAEAATGVPAYFGLTKVFEGHEWTEDYAFEFKLTAVTDGAPMPTDAEGNTADTVTVKAPTEGDGKTAKFDFGSIEYKTAGTYEYEVNEVPGSNAGITYATNTVKVTVRVTDNGHGGLVAAATMSGDTFTNTYVTGEVAFDAAGGLQITKNLTGRSIEKGAFTFTMTGADDGSIAKIGGKALEFTTEGAAIVGNAASETIDAVTNLTFTKADAGKKYTYTVAEVDGKAEGYDYDPATHEVAFKVIDGGNGTLTVEVYLDGTLAQTYSGVPTRAAVNPVVVEFDNAYKTNDVTVGGEGDVAIIASKVLEGRDQIAGEFSFDVMNVEDGSGDAVLTGSNADAADGATSAVAFDTMTFTTERLNNDVAAGLAYRETTDAGDVYTYQYTVSEDTTVAAFSEGVSAVKDSFTIKLKLTDDGKGNLAGQIVYPEGYENGLVFENVYGQGEQAQVNVNGTKVLNAADGLNKPDIAERFTFTISGSEGAPMPENTTATNDAAGNVDFGTITYTMENVFGGKVAMPEEPTVDEATGEVVEVAPLAAQRTKTFTYTVSEQGSVEGVTNDTEVKTFTVTVTDDGNGNLTAVKSTDGQATDFAFTNTYKVTPTVPVSPTDGAISVIKTLTGRDLVAGEFDFELVDEDGAVVSTGSNDADGNVTLSGIAFDAPGTHKFALREVVPEGDHAGVTYDGTVHSVTAVVTDNGDGTLSVEWSADSTEIVFENAYEAAATSVTLGAAKVLEGAELTDGQFAFKVVDRNGNVFREARNDATGKVTFPTIEFKEAGTYTYTVLEHNDEQEGVTYDDAQHEVVVTVTDDGKGNLVAEVAGDENLVFTNAYSAPEVPAEPEPEQPADKPEGPTFAKTNDSTPVLVAGLGGLAMLAIVGIGAGVYGVVRSRRRF